MTATFVEAFVVSNVAALTALDGTTNPRRAANVVVWVVDDGAGAPAEYMFASGAGSGTVEADDSAGYWNRLGGSATIADGSVTTAKLADTAVTTAKITNNAVTLAKIATQADNTITANLSGGVASPSAVAIESFVASLLQAANVTAAQQSLDLETGVDVQAHSAILAAMVSGYGAATSGDVFKKDGSNGAWAADSGGSGSTTFTGLTDTPANYTSSGGYAVRVNSGATALEFAAFNAALVGLGNVPNADATDASNISSGTLPDARLSASVTTSLGLADSALQAGDQIDADDVTTGTLPNARLSAVPLTALATQTDNTILANFSGGTAVPSAVTVAAHIETFLESADAAAARTAIGAGTGGGGVSVPIRNTVMSGPSSWLAAGTGLQVVSQNGAAVATIADGFSVAAGAANEIFEIPNAETWDSLTASDTCYLYVEWDGTLTTGHSILEPAYGSTAPSSPSTGQWWFDAQSYEGQSWNGSAWVAAPRLYVGQCTTDGSAVTAVVQYAYNGRAVVGGAVGLSANASYNHNLGTSLARTYGYFNAITGSGETGSMPNGSSGYVIGIGLYTGAFYFSALQINDSLSVGLRTGATSIYHGPAGAQVFTGATAQIFVERNF